MHEKQHAIIDFDYALWINLNLALFVSPVFSSVPLCILPCFSPESPHHGGVLSVSLHRESAARVSAGGDSGLCNWTAGQLESGFAYRHQWPWPLRPAWRHTIQTAGWSLRARWELYELILSYLINEPDQRWLASKWLSSIHVICMDSPEIIRMSTDAAVSISVMRIWVQTYII